MTTKSRKPVVDLSLDFDFFIREKMIWDWGHGEGEAMGEIFRHVIWEHRYGSRLNVFEETDIGTYADFDPCTVLGQLASRNLRTGNARSRKTVGVADSHLRAHDFFNDVWARDRPPAMLLQLDAHHDSWQSTKKMHCGNWLSALMEQHPGVRYRQAYPKWKDPRDDGPPNVPAGVDFDMQHWSEFKSEPMRLRHIFFCLSSAWVPPHHDAKFIEVVEWLAMVRKLSVLGDIPAREAPTQQKAMKMREEQAAQIKQLMQT